MDALDRIAGPARELLRTVDATFTALGVPDDPQLWSLLRRLGALPGDALDCVVALHADPLAVSASELRSRADRYEQECAVLAHAVDDTAWQGAAGDAFAHQWHALSAHLAGSAPAGSAPAGSGAGGSGAGGWAAGGLPDADSMAGRLSLLASYVDSVVDWVAQTRRCVAAALATVLCSVDAVALRPFVPAIEGAQPTAAPGMVAPGVMAAACAIAVTVLTAVDQSVQRGQDLYSSWSPRISPLAYRAADDPGAFTATIMSV